MTPAGLPSNLTLRVGDKVTINQLLKYAKHIHSPSSNPNVQKKDQKKSKKKTLSLEHHVRQRRI